MKTTFALIIGVLGIFVIPLVCFACGFYVGRIYEGEKAPLEEEITLQEPIDTLTQWQIMQMAIMKTESEFNPHAKGLTNDLGIMQITPIYVKEVNRLYHTTYSHEDAHSIDASLAMFNAIQEAKNPTKDINKAISLHNPRSASYLGKVKRNMGFISRYEECRRAVKSY